ncbi:hypothetical protein [Austwickia chelonae]|uniref:hypothetical protein n=1 Tax=Austwickia chelonae TaxID=100225 RepID=UPI0013C364CF|nr:hypothetical protein [Austwickia chelonae]
MRRQIVARIRGHRPVSADLAVVEDEAAVYVERGSFSHACCAACGWEGPGRRARSLAVSDASQHRCRLLSEQAQDVAGSHGVDVPARAG